MNSKDIKAIKAIKAFLADAYYSHEITPQDYAYLLKKAEAL